MARRSRPTNATFQHLYFGDLGANASLSGALIEQAKQNLGLLKARLGGKLRNSLECCESGQTPVHLNDDSFTIPENHISDVVNMGNWQLRISAKCDWQCGSPAKADNCSCNCKVNCKLDAFISKTYTFKRGYNPLNSSFGIGVLNSASWYAQSALRWNWEPTYFVSAHFTDSYSATLNPRCKN